MLEKFDTKGGVMAIRVHRKKGRRTSYYITVYDKVRDVRHYETEYTMLDARRR